MSAFQTTENRELRALGRSLEIAAIDARNKIEDIPENIDPQEEAYLIAEASSVAVAIAQRIIAIYATLEVLASQHEIGARAVAYLDGSYWRNAA